MASFIFMTSFLFSFSFSIIYINPYLFIIWVFISYFFALVILILFYLLNFPIILMLRASHPYKAYLMRSLARVLNNWILNLKVEIKGLENIPSNGAIVAYANHKSYTDAFALIQHFPRPITLSPKKTVLKIPFFKWWLKAYDVFPINRESPKETLEALEYAIKTVQNGHTILIFPEGTIKNRLNPKVENVKAGSFRLASKAQADILPIRIEGNDLVRKRWPFRTKRKIIIFPVIPYPSFQNLNTKDISNLFLDKINSN